MSNPFPIPLAIMLSNGSRLATPPTSAGVQTLQNDGTNEPRWVVAGSVSALVVLASDPFPPVEGSAWIVATGTSPTATISLKAYRDGAAHTIASVTY